MSDVEESAERLKKNLLSKGLPEKQVDRIVEMYKEGVGNIKKGKLELNFVNKPKGRTIWSKKKIEKRKEVVKSV